ncbi:MAG: FecR domain-containing protein, partial [Bacteroidales bacterium]|nr:FecR domain-containing protein [Bacteroidales bacterium]
MINYNDLAKKYFSGRINADEENELYAWVREDESHLDQLHAWEDEWKGSEENSQDVSWERMLGRIAAREVLEGGDFRTTKKTVRWWPYAAAAVMALGILLRVALPHDNRQIYAMEAPVGEKCRVFLPDSTVVWLNSDSRLSFDESFNHKVRNVKLVGEGYFEVAHNENKPFSV